MWSGQAVLCMWLGDVVGYGLERERRVFAVHPYYIAVHPYLFCGIKVYNELRSILINSNKLYL
jgi:hypothetical protein